MFRKEYMPLARGFDEHMGYLQGCESHYTHVASCCGAGSPDNDTRFVCSAPAEGEGGGGVDAARGYTVRPGAEHKDFRGYDWFRSSGGESLPDPSANQSNSATLIRDAAVDFIARQRVGRPFFLYLPFQNIHGPYTCDAAFRHPYESQPDRFTPGEMTMFGYITELDTAVGAVVHALRDHGRYETSLFVFSSDNGAPPASDDVNHRYGGSDPGYIARNHPFRGHKALIWEGGTRVPGFVSGGSPLLPAGVRGTVSHALMHITDWLPTLTKLTAIPTPPLALDGIDVSASLLDGTVPSPRTEMLYNVNPLCASGQAGAGQAGAPKAGIRIGDFKLLAWCFSVAGIGGGNTTGPSPAPHASPSVDPEFTRGRGLVLYNLATDPGETTNLAHDPPHAATVEKLLSRLTVLAVESVEPQQWTAPYQGPNYECASCPLHPGGTGPDQPWLPWL